MGTGNRFATLSGTGFGGTFVSFYLWVAVLLEGSALSVIRVWLWARLDPVLVA